jgi:REP element-mobilizing transposase RayT
MADVDYTFAFATKNRWDILDTPKVARCRTILQEVISEVFDGLVLGTARIVDDYVQVRIRADDQHATENIARYLRGQLSLKLGIEFSDVDITYGRKTHIFNRNSYIALGNSSNSEVDDWVTDNHINNPNPA